MNFETTFIDNENSLKKKISNLNDCIVLSNKKYIDNIEPATGNTYSLIPDSDVIDVKNAIKSAEKNNYKILHR